MMVSSVIIFENYAASFTSFLSVVKLFTPFETLEDLYKKTSYKIGSIQGTSYKSMLLGVRRKVS